MKWLQKNGKIPERPSRRIWWSHNLPWQRLPHRFHVSHPIPQMIHPATQYLWRIPVYRGDQPLYWTGPNLHAYNSGNNEFCSWSMDRKVHSESNAIPESIFAFLIFITKWNFYLRTITSAIAKSPREWLRIKSGNICPSLQRFQYLSFQSFRVDIFKDDSSGRQLDYAASHFFPLNRYNGEKNWIRGHASYFPSNKTYISGLDRELNVVTEFHRVSNAFGFREMEEDFAHDITTLDKSKAFFQRTHHSLVTNWMSRIFQADVTSSQVTANKNKQTKQWDLTDNKISQRLK